jgi:hypothetical protein
LSKVKELSLNDVSETIIRRVSGSVDTVETILHFHWRLILHSLLHHDRVVVDDYIIIQKDREGFRLELTPKTQAYLK